jgi:hypothetical protein
MPVKGESDAYGQHGQAEKLLLSEPHLLLPDRQLRLQHVQP